MTREPLDDWLERTKRTEARYAVVRLAEYAALVAAIIAACVWAAIK